MVFNSDMFVCAKAQSRIQAQRLLNQHTKADGNWLARLIQNNPRVLKTFADHEAIAEKLEAANEAAALRDIASMGVIDSTASRYYRDAFHRLMAHA